MEERARQRSEMIKKAKQRKAQKEKKKKDEAEQKDGEEKASDSSSSDSSDESSDDEEVVETPQLSEIEEDGFQEPPQDPLPENKVQLVEESKEKVQQIPVQAVPALAENVQGASRSARKRKPPSRGDGFIRTDSLAFSASSCSSSEASDSKSKQRREK